MRIVCLANKREACRITGMKERTLYQWINKGKLDLFIVPGRKTTLLDCDEISRKMKK